MMAESFLPLAFEEGAVVVNNQEEYLLDAGQELKSVGDLVKFLEQQETFKGKSVTPYSAKQRVIASKTGAASAVAFIKVESQSAAPAASAVVGSPPVSPRAPASPRAPTAVAAAISSTMAAVAAPVSPRKMSTTAAVATASSSAGGFEGSSVGGRSPAPADRLGSSLNIDKPLAPAAGSTSSSPKPAAIRKGDAKGYDHSHAVSAVAAMFPKMKAAPLKRSEDASADSSGSMTVGSAPSTAVPGTTLLKTSTSGSAALFDDLETDSPPRALPSSPAPLSPRPAATIPPPLTKLPPPPATASTDPATPVSPTPKQNVSLAGRLPIAVPPPPNASKFPSVAPPPLPAADRPPVSPSPESASSSLPPPILSPPVPAPKGKGGVLGAALADVADDLPPTINSDKLSSAAADLLFGSDEPPKFAALTPVAKPAASSLGLTTGVSPRLHASIPATEDPAAAAAAAEELKKKRETEEAAKRAEEEKQRKLKEAREKAREEEERKAAEEEARRAEERKRREDIRRKKAEEEARKKAEHDAREQREKEEIARKLEDTRKRMAEKEAEKKLEDDKKRQLEEEKRRQQEEDKRKRDAAVKRAAEQAEALKQTLDDQAQKRADEEARKRREEEEALRAIAEEERELRRQKLSEARRAEFAAHGRETLGGGTLLDENDPALHQMFASETVHGEPTMAEGGKPRKLKYFTKFAKVAGAPARRPRKEGIREHRTRIAVQLKRGRNISKKHRELEVQREKERAAEKLRMETELALEKSRQRAERLAAAGNQRITLLFKNQAALAKLQQHLQEDHTAIDELDKMLREEEEKTPEFMKIKRKIEAAKKDPSVRPKLPAKDEKERKPQEDEIEFLKRQLDAQKKKTELEQQLLGTTPAPAAPVPKPTFKTAMPSTRVAPVAQMGSSLSVASKSDIKEKEKEKEPPKDEGTFSILDDKNFLDLLNQQRTSGAGPAIKNEPLTSSSSSSSLASTGTNSNSNSAIGGRSAAPVPQLPTELAPVSPRNAHFAGTSPRSVPKKELPAVPATASAASQVSGVLSPTRTRPGWGAAPGAARAMSPPHTRGFAASHRNHPIGSPTAALLGTEPRGATPQPIRDEHSSGEASKGFARPAPKKAAKPPVEERFTLLLQKLALNDLQASIDAEIGPPNRDASHTVSTNAALKELDDLLVADDRERAVTGNTAAIDELDAILKEN